MDLTAKDLRLLRVPSLALGEATGTWDAKVQKVWVMKNNHLFVLSRFGCIGDTNLHIFITYLYKVYTTRPL